MEYHMRIKKRFTSTKKWQNMCVFKNIDSGILLNSNNIPQEAKFDIYKNHKQRFGTRVDKNVNVGKKRRLKLDT